MAKRTRPILVTGVALASAAAIVTATPEILPTNGVELTASSTSTKVSYAKYELTAISDITLSGINDAYWFGWGGYIGACCDANGDPFDPSVIYPADADGNPPFVSNPYYPGVNGPVAVYDPDTGDLLGYQYNQGGVYASGAPGVLYYLADNILESLSPSFDLDNYYFEIGIPALPYVAAGELFGTSSPIFQAAQSVFYYGIPNVINSIVVSATTLVPTFNIGPVELGGGTLASLYFYGVTPAGDAYGSGGVSSILAYISTSISDSLPSAASLSAAAAGIETAVKDAESAVKAAISGTGSSAAAKKATSKTAATEVKTEDTTSTGDTTSTEDTSATEATTPAPKATGTASSAKPATTTAPKTAKKPSNPLNKIGKQISDALGITKKSKPSTKTTSSDSSSSSSSSGEGSGSSAK